MTAKRYDIAAFVEAATEDQFTAHPGNSSLAVITCPGGFVVTDSEGIHWTTADLTNDEIVITVVPRAGEGEAKEVAAKTGAVVEAVDGQDVELGDYVRRFGRRLESNYALLLDSIKEMGGNPEDYPRNREEPENGFKR
jgi:hypothetical protein